MGNRLRGTVTLLLASLLNGTTSLSLFYVSGLITTIGTSLQIPFILGGFVAGSVAMPLAGYLLFRQGRFRVALSMLSIPISFLAVWSYVDFTRLIGNYEMLLLSALCVAGDIFVAALFAYRGGSGITTAIGHGLGGMFVMTIMLIAYAALFDSHMPLIILTGELLSILLLALAALTGRRTGASTA